ncbi:MAG: hypothetical protein SFZ24_00280 [Planctomycetota bacterium]|nr:hypothetical protein [Planctomycetota bacterium]
MSRGMLMVGVACLAGLMPSVALGQTRIERAVISLQRSADQYEEQAHARMVRTCELTVARIERYDERGSSDSLIERTSDRGQAEIDRLANSAYRSAQRKLRSTQSTLRRLRADETTRAEADAIVASTWDTLAASMEETKAPIVAAEAAALSDSDDNGSGDDSGNGEA